MTSRYDPIRGERRAVTLPISPVITDDRGVYRLFGLPAGSYLIAAVPRPVQGLGDGAEVQSEADVRSALAEVRESRGAARPGIPVPAARTAPVGPERPAVRFTRIYFPGTPLQERAMPITLAAGQVRSDVDFDIDYVPISTIEGSVTVPPGMRVQVAIADAGSGSVNETTRMTARAGDDGQFTFRSIPPGTYTITARAFPSDTRSGATPAQTSLWAETSVSVAGEDISGIALALEPALSLAGRVVFESASGASPDLGVLRVPLAAISISSNNPVQLPSVVVDGARFSITGVIPGTYRFVSPPRGLRAAIGGWWLKSVMVHGRELLDADLELRQSTDDGVITFSDRASEVSGIVSDRDGAPEADGYVVVFAADKKAWFHGSRRVAGVRPATDGRYVVRNLPPGEYLVTAALNLEPNEWFDPEVLEGLAPGAIRIQLRENEVRDQMIRQR